MEGGASGSSQEHAHFSASNAVKDPVSSTAISSSDCAEENQATRVQRGELILECEAHRRREALRGDPCLRQMRCPDSVSAADEME